MHALRLVTETNQVRLPAHSGKPNTEALGFAARKIFLRVDWPGDRRKCPDLPPRAGVGPSLPSMQ